MQAFRYEMISSSGFEQFISFQNILKIMKTCSTENMKNDNNAQKSNVKKSIVHKDAKLLGTK